MANSCRAGRRPIKAATSREAWARDAHLPLPDGDGLAPQRQAGDAAGAPHSSLATRTGPTHIACRSSSRYRRHCARRMRMFCPIRLSRTGRHGTRRMPMPSSIMAKRSFLRRPDTAVIRTGGAASVHETLLVPVHRLAWNYREPGGIGNSRAAARMAGCGVCQPSFAPTIRQ